MTVTIEQLANDCRWKNKEDGREESNTTAAMMVRSVECSGRGRHYVANSHCVGRGWHPQHRPVSGLDDGSSPSNVSLDASPHWKISSSTALAAAPRDVVVPACLGLFGWRSFLWGKRTRKRQPKTRPTTTMEVESLCTLGEQHRWARPRDPRHYSFLYSMSQQGSGRLVCSSFIIEIGGPRREKRGLVVNLRGFEKELGMDATVFSPLDGNRTSLAIPLLFN